MTCVCVMQAHNSTNSTEDVEVSFPEDLYSQTSKAAVSKRYIIIFVMSLLFISSF